MTGEMIPCAQGQATARHTVPALFAPDREAARRFVEFFTANIRNPNTRRAYARAAAELAAWCEQNGLRELRDIEPVHVAAYVETLQTRLSAPSVKLHLAGIRMLFDWLVVGPGGRRQPGKLGARTQALGQERQDAGAHRRGDARAPGLD